MHYDAVSPFATLRPGYIGNQSLPLSLQPTALQRSKEHHPWLDCFPFPSMRDNLLRALDGFDEDQLCLDIMGSGIRPWIVASCSSGGSQRTLETGR